MAIVTVERYDRVSIKDTPVPAHGIVLAVFDDLKNRPCAAVQWAGGFMGVSRLSTLVKM